jgi:excisionase family DNA binding protein
MTNSTEYLRAGDIARLTGMSLRTVRRWIADEIVPSTKFGGARLVAKAELGRLLSPPPTATEVDTNGADKKPGE